MTEEVKMGALSKHAQLMFITLLLLSNSFYATNPELDAVAQELDASMVGMDQISNAVQATVQEIEDGMQREKEYEVRNANKILWSIPAAFSDADFEQESKDLHANIPLYGKVSLGNKAYARYKKWLEEFKTTHGIDKWNPFFHGGMEAHQALQRNFSLQTGLPANVASNRIFLERLQHSPVKNVFAPGLELFDYFNGTRLPGIGLYRSDLNEIGFLAANMGTGYLFFKDIKLAKLDKIKTLLTEDKDTFTSFLKQLISNDDKKSIAKIKEEIRSLVEKKGALFRYNPCKPYVILPMIKYIFFQRIIENIKIEKRPYLRSSDQQYAFIKNTNGDLVRSAITPFSIMSLIRIILSPIAVFSQTTRETLHSAGRRLRFTDRLFGRFHAPSRFYRLFSSVIGEGLVLVMVIKIMDSYFNDQFVESMVAKAEHWLSILEEDSKLDSKDGSFQESTARLVAYQERLEKEIELALSSGKSGFWSWVQAQRATFTKITIGGFLCFVAPSLILKGAPLLAKLFKTRWRHT